MAELLAVPLKKSSDVELVKPLRNLLAATQGAGADDFAEQLAELARLRSNAIWKVFDKASLDVLYSYYDQLVSLESKVPPQEVQVPFKWKDAFDKGSIFGGRMSLTISSLGYERVCIMFNIGAMQTTIAAAQSLDTEDSLKLAAKLLQQAAGVFAALRAGVMAAVQREPTPDLAPDALHALHALALAQAQEVIARKCTRDEMKEGAVAKVCAACEELYTDALRAASRDHLKPLWDRDWIPTMQAKQMAFRGLAQLYQSAVCRQNKQVGEEIARLQLSVEQLKGAARLPAGAPPFLIEAAARAARLLADANKDNDFIYHERVPEAAALEPLQRAVIAKALPPPERWTADRDLFAALVPAALQRALQAAEARRGELVGRELDRLREDAQLLSSVLASLNLPACAEPPARSGALPESVRARAAAVRAAGGLPALQRLRTELPELLQRNRDVLDEAERLLREEEEADRALRDRFGARWRRTESRALTEAFRANAAKYRQIIDNAVRADEIVQNKFQQHRESIELLSRSEDEIAAGVPAGEAGEAGAADCDAAAELRGLMEEVERLRAERERVETELKELRADVAPQLAAEPGADAGALAAAALAPALSALAGRGASARERQEALLARVQAAHARLSAARGGSSSRDDALGRLCAAHDAYTDLTANLQEGVKFYNDLTQLLVAFQNKVSDYCFARKTEKDELMKDLTQEASRPPQEPTVSRKEAPPRPPPPASAPGAPAPAPGAPASAPGAAPQAAALPYPSQPQGMPLPYAPAMAPYPYYAAPMPVTYNPYATLPYPHHARLPAAQPYQPYQHPPAPAAPAAPGYPQPPPAGYNPYGGQ